MTVTEFIRKKNEILYKHLEVVLVPEDQIEECEQGTLSCACDAQACPYCAAYYFNCENCPMFKKGNICNEASTYGIVLNKARQVTGTRANITDPECPWSQELRDLIEQYNAELNLRKD